MVVEVSMSRLSGGYRCVPKLTGIRSEVEVGLWEAVLWSRKQSVQERAAALVPVLALEVV
jgi:hypothetical protein